MLIKKPSDISSSEITPKKLYLNRRNFLLGAGAVAGVAVVANRLGTIASPQTSVLAGTKLDYTKSSLQY